MRFRIWSALYLIFGCFFVYSAYLASNPSIWNWKALLFAAFATFDFKVALDHWFRHRQLRH